VSSPRSAALGALTLALLLAVALVLGACGDDGDDRAATTAATTSTAGTGAARPTGTAPDAVTTGTAAPEEPDAPPATTDAGPPTTSADGTAPPAPPTAPEPSAPADAAVALYWTRPYADTRPVQLPFHRDPATGPLPYLLYGSMTNTGATAIASPTVVVTWRDAGGAVVHEAVAAAIDPLGVPLASLEPGASADVLVVVADPAVGPALATATPELAPWSA
jgi:hypothetical protein